MNSLIKFKFDDECTMQAWETYKKIGSWDNELIAYCSDGYRFRLRQIPTLSAINFLKMFGFVGVDSHECLILNKSEFESYMNFLSTLNGI